MDNLFPGQDVEVQTRFDGDWVTGFRVERAMGQGYLVRRLVDGATLPDPMLEHELRASVGPRSYTGRLAQRRAIAVA